MLPTSPGKMCQTQTTQAASPHYDIRIDGLSSDPPASSEHIALQSIACSALVRLTLLAASSMLAASRAVAQNATLHGVGLRRCECEWKARRLGAWRVGSDRFENQRDAVVTDSLGRFEIPAGTTGIVFVSVPDGFRSNGAFWRATTAAPASVDFGLVRQAQSRTFSFVHASDSHCPENVDRFRRFRRMTDSLGPAFVLMGGDLYATP